MKKNEAKYKAKELGLNKFFDGIPCKNGHIAERYTRNSACVQCSYEQSLAKKEYAKAYAEKNKQLIRQKQKDYREKNKEKLSQYHSKYRKKYIDKLTQYSKKYHIKNAEKIRNRTKQWAIDNKEKALANSKLSQANRRARKQNATPKWADTKAISEIYKNCPKGMEVDHIIPLGGKYVCGLHVENNLQYLPSDENRSKAAFFDMT